MRSAFISLARSIPAVVAVCISVLPATGGTPPHLAPDDLTAAVRFEEDRAVAQQVATARDALRRGDRTQAVGILQEVLDSDAAGLVSTTDGYSSASHQAWDLLRTAPPDAIEQYRRHSSGAARAELNAALRSGAEQDLVRVVMRYRFTDAGKSALEALAQKRLDSGGFPEAADLYQELIRGAPDPAQEARNNPHAVQAWILALLESGDGPAALRIAAEFPSSTAANRRLEGLLSRLRVQASPESSFDSTLDGRDLIRRLPSSRAEWEFQFPDEDAMATDVATYLREFAVESVAPILQARPLEVPAGLVIRTVEGVVRLDSRTGELAWRWTGATEADRTGAIGPFGTRGLLRMLERAVGDSVHSGLAADRNRVYFLEQESEASVFVEEQPLSNTLIALDVETGVEVWRRGDTRQTVEDEDFRDVFFRGAPTVFGDEILVIADRAATMELFALDASTGDLNWSVKLCELAVSPVRDDRRLAQGCRVLLTAGKAVCPTGGGGLVAVDLLSRRMWWARRYAREPVYEDDIGSRSQAQTPRELVWADAWSAPHLSASGRRIVLASAESDLLHVLNADSGALLWTRPRLDATCVGCVTDAHVILVHPHRVSAVGLDDGSVHWTAAVDQPSGQGCVANGHFLLPLTRGGVAAIRLTDGRVTQTFSTTGVRPNILPDAEVATATVWRPVTLASVGEQVVEQSLDGVRRLMDVGAALDGSAAEAANNPEDVDLAIRYAGHLREAGDFHAAADLLLARNFDNEDESSSDRLRRVALDAMLTGSWLASSPATADIEERLIETEADRVRYEVCRLRGALRDPSPAIIDEVLTLVDLGAERYFLEREDGGGWVRLDRQAQAWLQQVLNGADTPTRQLLEEALTQALQERGVGAGGAEAHRVLSCLDHIAAAQRLRVELPPRWSTIGEFIEYELELEQLAAQGDSGLAARALVALMSLYEAHSDYRQAARTFLRLESLATEHSVADVIPSVPDDSPLQPYLEDPSLPAWPARAPDISSAPGTNDDALYFTHPEIVAESPALVDGLTVSLPRNGGVLRFTGGAWSQQWDLDLPPARGFAELMRNEVFADLRRVWTFGNLLVIQDGGHVFGVAPLDRNGEASAELVWPERGELISAGERVAQIFTHPRSDAPRPHGFPERRLLLDQRLQPVGEVGPVRRGYFCVRRGGELTARRTVTGERLWTRSGIPPAAQCHGDDEHLVLIRPDSPQVSVLRALDGALLSTYDWALHGAELLTCYGCRALVLQSTPASPDAGLHLTLSDLTTGDPVWSRPVAENAVCFPVDDLRCGLLEPDGTVRLMELSSGEDFAVEQVERPGRLIGVRTMLDPDTLFLLLTEPIDDPEIQATIRPDGNSPNTGFRNFEVNGGMHAFERSTGRLRWSRDVDNAVALLDQAEDVPLLVFKELRVEGPGSSLLRNRMRVFDKRTGDVLLDETSSTPFSRYIVRRDREEGWVEIHCPDRTYRFNYTPPADGDEAP